MQTEKAVDINQTFELPGRVEGTTPTLYNCHTDGGFINPQSQLWSLGGAGIWCPEAMLENDGKGHAQNKQLWA